MDRKKDPQKIDFWRLGRRDRARGGGSLLWHLGLKLTKSNPCLARLAPRRGRRIEDALRQATAAPVILAWLSVGGLRGLWLACPCGRFVFRQGLGRSWHVLGRMSGIATKQRVTKHRNAMHMQCIGCTTLLSKQKTTRRRTTPNWGRAGFICIIFIYIYIERKIRNGRPSAPARWPEAKNSSCVGGQRKKQNLRV